MAAISPDYYRDRPTEFIRDHFEQVATAADAAWRSWARLNAAADDFGRLLAASRHRTILTFDFEALQQPAPAHKRNHA